MANRRFGGPSNKIGGGGFGQQNFGNKVNPWQGGAGPNSNANSGLLSQLSAPQAQLALAISSLLQPQQMHSNPPSLLSLPTNPSFNNQDHFGSQNRFNNRGRDFRRPEPYNKLGQGRGWRDNSTRPADSYGRSSNRSASRGNRRSPSKGGKNKNNDNKSQASNKSSDVNVNDSSKNNKDETIPSSIDDSRDEDAFESNEKKRDWKQEKNNEDAENAEDEGTAGEDGPENETEGTVPTKKEPKEKKPREGRYHGVPPSLLHCFVCNKSMWDGESFQNHLRGKAHKQMMDSLGQSFQITVNILRENMRLVEEKKMIELERMTRNNRGGFHRHQQEPQSHCNMCDLKFLGKIISHRKTEGHQRLKRFLHPKCEYCTQEFPSRMEWVDHRFTPDHLRKMHEVLETKVKGEFGAPIIEEEAPEADNDPLLDESLQTEDENPVLELTDDLKDLHNRLPAFKPSRAIATQAMQPASGFYCDICKRFMTTEVASKDHLRTEKHYISFIEAAKKKYKRQQDEEKAAEDRLAKKRKAEEEEADITKKAKTDEDDNDASVNAENGDDTVAGSEMYDPEEACKESDSSALMDTTTFEEEFAEVDRLIQSVNEEEAKHAKVEVKEEAVAEKPEVPSSPRLRRAATVAAATTGVGAVRNGAGPRSKTRRGGGK